MINLARERLIIRSLELTMKRCLAKGMSEEQTAIEIYKTIILPVHNDLRDEWVSLLKSSDGEPN